MRAWLIGLMSLVPLSVLGASCALGSFERIGGDDPSADAGVDLGCQHATVPLPPNLADADVEGGVDQTFVVAFRKLRMLQQADGTPLGLDLDRFCSCQGETPSCIAPPTQPEELWCDQSEGRDNNAKALFTVIQVGLNLGMGDALSQRFSDAAEVGKWSVLFQVSGYNGLENDDKLRVEWYPSGGLPTGTIPGWSGQDAWPVSPESYSDMAGTIPRFVDDDAYVTKGMLVFSLPQGTLEASDGQARMGITITDATVMARLVNDGAGFQLRDGVIAGRITVLDLFKMLSDFRDHKGDPFCTNGNLIWLETRDTICRSLDIQTGSPLPNKPCDATSFAVGFDADPAMLGPTLPITPSDKNCEPGADPLSAVMAPGGGCPQ